MTVNKVYQVSDVVRSRGIYSSLMAEWKPQSWKPDRQKINQAQSFCRGCNSLASAFSVKITFNLSCSMCKIERKVKMEQLHKFTDEFILFSFRNNLYVNLTFQH